LAPGILALFRDVLLNDHNYLERVKRHYRLFRNAIEKGGIPSSETRREGPCQGRRPGAEDDSTEETMSPVLVPCPFCGGTDLLQTDKMVNEDTAGPEEWFVVCGNCSAMGPLASSSAKAQAAWNRRIQAGAAADRESAHARGGPVPEQEDRVP
jgi:Lar family restriction alleviation protein